MQVQRLYRSSHSGGKQSYSLLSLASAPQVVRLNLIQKTQTRLFSGCVLEYRFMPTLNPPGGIARPSDAASVDRPGTTPAVSSAPVYVSRGVVCLVCLSVVFAGWILAS